MAATVCGKVAAVHKSHNHARSAIWPGFPATRISLVVRGAGRAFPRGPLRPDHSRKVLPFAAALLGKPDSAAASGSYMTSSYNSRHENSGQHAGRWSFDTTIKRGQPGRGRARPRGASLLRSGELGQPWSPLRRAEKPRREGQNRQVNRWSWCRCAKLTGTSRPRGGSSWLGATPKTVPPCLAHAANLTAFEQALVATVAAGRQLDPTNGQEIDVSRGTHWGPERTIRAKVLKDMITGDPKRPSPRGATQGSANTWNLRHRLGATASPRLPCTQLLRRPHPRQQRRVGRGS